MFRNINNIFIILFALFAFTAFNSCEKELDTPPVTSLDYEPNATLSDIMELYDGSQDFVTIEQDFVLEVIVTANDKSGNFYRQLIIQDETGGIELKIHQTNLHEQYPLGQKLYIRTRNLILGSFGGIVQLGGTVFDAGGLRLGGIEVPEISNHIARIPGGTEPEPLSITLGENLDQHIYTKVTLENVQFAETELGSTFANPNQTTNRTLTDCQGNTIIVRTSSFADFAGQTLPEGNGTITAVLSKFVNDYQLLINSIDDVNMTGERCEVEGEGTGTGTFEDPFNVAAAYDSNTGSGVWVEGYIVGVRETDVDPFVNNFSTPFRTNSNLIIADNPEETNPSNLLIVQLIVNDVRFDLNLVENPEMLGEQVKLKGDLAAYFGFPGMRNTSDYWMEGMPEPDPGTDPDPQEPVTSIDENFQSYDHQADVNRNGWNTLAEAGTRVWRTNTFNNDRYAQATAFNSTDSENIMWLITPPIDLDAMSNPVFEFESAQAFYTHDGLSLHISANFDGENLEQATWQPLQAVLAGENDPEHNWINSGNIDLSGFNGIVHIAWKYEAAAPQNKTGTFRINNVKLYQAR